MCLVYIGQMTERPVIIFGTPGLVRMRGLRAGFPGSTTCPYWCFEVKIQDVADSNCDLGGENEAGTPTPWETTPHADDQLHGVAAGYALHQPGPLGAFVRALSWPAGAPSCYRLVECCHVATAARALTLGLLHGTRTCTGSV